MEARGRDLLNMFEKLSPEAQEMIFNLCKLNLGAKLQPFGKWVSVQDAASHFGKSDDTIRRWINDGKLMSKRESERKTVVYIEDMA